MDIFKSIHAKEQKVLQFLSDFKSSTGTGQRIILRLDPRNDRGTSHSGNKSDLSVTILDLGKIY